MSKSRSRSRSRGMRETPFRCEYLKKSYTKSELMELAAALGVRLAPRITAVGVCLQIAKQRPDLMRTGWKNFLFNIGSIAASAAVGGIGGHFYGRPEERKIGDTIFDPRLGVLGNTWFRGRKGFGTTTDVPGELVDPGTRKQTMRVGAGIMGSIAAARKARDYTQRRRARELMRAYSRARQYKKPRAKRRSRSRSRSRS